MIEQEPNFWEKRELLPSLTTLSRSGQTWRDKLTKITDLNLHRVTVFLTGLQGERETEEIISSLKENSSIKEVPMVHITNLTRLRILEKLNDMFGTKIFVIHSEGQFELKHDLTKYYDWIFVENTSVPLKLDELKAWGGACLDFAHLECAQHNHPELYQNWLDIYSQLNINDRTIGCNHISAVSKSPDGKYTDSHRFTDFKEFDHLIFYRDNQPELFSSVIALEDESPINRQLEAIDYIRKLLNHQIVVK
jgi:hypothetical protein